MTSLMDSENGIEREALAAWHEDRRGWSIVRCNRCGLDAVARLVYLWETDEPGTYTEGRQQPVCVLHRDELLDLFERVRVSSPEAVSGLVLTLGAA